MSRDTLTQSIIDYMATRRTPYTDWQEAAREACRLLLTEARRDTLRALGGEFVERHESMLVKGVWVVPE